MEEPDSIAQEVSRRRKGLQQACLLAIFIIFAAIALDVIGVVRLRAAVKAARAGGEPLTYEEILARRPVYPADVDAVPVYLRLQPRLNELGFDSVLDRLSFRRRFGRRSPLGYRWSDDDRQTVGAVLEQLRPELDQLEKLQGAGGSLPLTLTENVMETAEPRLWELRLAARLCGLQALHAVEQGDLKSLPRHLAPILALSRMASTHPTLQGAMMSYSCDEQAVAVLERACSLAVFPTEVLTSLESALAGVENQEPLYWGMLGERARFFAVGRLMLKTGTSPIGGVPAIGRVPGLRGLLMMDMAAGMTAYNRLLAEVHEPAACMEAMQEMDPEFSDVPRPYWLTQALYPRPQMACQTAFRRLARIRAAQVALAAERFRLDKGRFPARLAEMMPEYLSKTPIDPANGRSLRYWADAQGVVVYSIAESSSENAEWGERSLTGFAPQMAFMLLAPEQRGRPAPQPTTAPR